jgi:SAM-dependent methyltransferase
MIGALLLTVIFILLFFFAVIFVFWEMDLVINGKAPFVVTPSRCIPAIAKALQLTDSSVLYDLGCGGASVLIGCYKQCPEAHYVGMDRSAFAYVVSLVNVLKAHAAVAVLHKDFFKYDLKPATHVYTWLSKPVLDELLPKLEQDLRPGTRFVCLDFPFSKKQPVEKIPLSNKPFGHTLYVYQF